MLCQGFQTSRVFPEITKSRHKRYSCSYNETLHPYTFIDFSFSNRQLSKPRIAATSLFPTLYTIPTSFTPPRPSHLHPTLPPHPHRKTRQANPPSLITRKPRRRTFLSRITICSSISKSASQHFIIHLPNIAI